MIDIIMYLIEPTLWSVVYIMIAIAFKCVVVLLLIRAQHLAEVALLGGLAWSEDGSCLHH